jgi:hypothetical protein
VKKTTLARLVALGAAVTLTLGTQSACSAERTELNELKMVYLSGIGDDRQFDRCIAPGQAGEWSADNDVFVVPTDKRTWNIAPSEDADQREPIVSGTIPKTDPETKTSRPGPTVDVWLTTDFYLHWDCGFDYSKSLKGQRGAADSPVVTFFNRTGRSAEISSNTGDFNLDKWRSMLRTTLAKVEMDVIQAETRKHDADDLDANIGDVYSRMEAAMGPAFQEALKAKMGGEYFCGVEYAGGRPVSWTEKTIDAGGQIVETTKTGPCPPVRIDVTNIDLHDRAIQEARTRTYVVEQEARAALTKAESDKKIAQLADDPRVMELRKQQNVLDIERERTRQVELCSKTDRAVCVVGGGSGVGVNVNR